MGGRGRDVESKGREGRKGFVMIIVNNFGYSIVNVKLIWIIKSVLELW